jgi:hypothetical protein
MNTLEEKLRDEAREKRVRFHGLIQHSFALRAHVLHRPFSGSSVEEMVRSRFGLPPVDGAEFRVTPVGRPRKRDQQAGLVPHSLLAKDDLTTTEPRGVPFLEQEDGVYEMNLPKPFSWAGGDCREDAWKRFVFASRGEDDRAWSNDFVIDAVGGERPESEREAGLVAHALCELLAHRRSQLFGLVLANRFVNVMLPHALLTPTPELGGCGQDGVDGAAGRWILQPLVTLIRVRHDGRDFRRMYSMSFFLIPVADPGCEAREMSAWEISRVVRAGWGLAAARWPVGFPRFALDGPLPAYVSRLAPVIDRNLRPAPLIEGEAGGSAQASWRPLTLRQTAEAVMFAISLRMAEGPADRARERVQQEIGDNVVTSLGSSRVSSVLVVDSELATGEVPGRRPRPTFPGSLGYLMRTLARENRVASRRRYRLDRDFFDPERYAIGVLPSNRCIVFTTAESEQYGRSESGLMQAGWIAYMAIGAAAAIGTMRAIDRDLEMADGSEPTKVAQIEHDVVVDLHEIYDLDITWEAYRHRYRLLRDQLGITADYQALEGKLHALYRETDARYDAKTQRRLVVLTAAIVILSAFILAGTILLAVK